MKNFKLLGIALLIGAVLVSFVIFATAQDKDKTEKPVKKTETVKEAKCPHSAKTASKSDCCDEKHVKSDCDHPHAKDGKVHIKKAKAGADEAKCKTECASKCTDAKAKADCEKKCDETKKSQCDKK